jgi:AcrR family transcriptional regulator
MPARPLVPAEPQPSASGPALLNKEAPAVATRRPGRPRSEDRCLAIRGAALSLLVERGFAEVSIESIAARAGVGKATIYRRFPSKADLIVHAFFETVAPCVRIHDSGDLRADFRRQLRLVVREMAGPNGRALATLIACMQMDADLAESFRTRWLAVRRAEGRLALVHGIERGEIPRGTDPDVVLDALYSPLHFRLLAGHGPLSTDFSDRIVDLVFDGLGAAKSRGAKRASAAKRTASQRADRGRGGPRPTHKTRGA